MASLKLCMRTYVSARNGRIWSVQYMNKYSEIMAMVKLLSQSQNSKYLKVVCMHHYVFPFGFLMKMPPAGW